MITDMQIFSPRVGVVPFSQGVGPENSDAIQIRKIDGLGPVDATINMGQYAGIDGEFYTGRTIPDRNIVITVGFNPDWSSQTIADLRLALYQYLMTGSLVTLRFNSTHMATVEISGYVESMDPDIFAKSPEIPISIICPPPAFIATDSVVITGTTLSLSDGTPTDIEYQGNLPTGFQLLVASNSTVAESNGEVRVINTYLGATSVFDINPVDIKSGATLDLSTLQGQKYLQLDTSASSSTNILGKQVPGSVWIQLDQGTNNFRVLSTTAGLSWTLTYYARYGGL